MSFYATYPSKSGSGGGGSDTIIIDNGDGTYTANPNGGSGAVTWSTNGGDGVQIAYVDNVTGNDGTAELNNDSLPFETIAAACSAYTASKCVMFIQQGDDDYQEAANPFGGLSTSVIEFTVVSYTAKITAVTPLRVVGNPNLNKFLFYGKDTIIEGSNSTLIEVGSSNTLAKFFLVLGGIVQNSPSSYTLALIGTCDILVQIYGDVNAGITIRDGFRSRVYIHGDLTSASTSNAASCVEVRNINGDHLVEVYGVIDNSLQTNIRGAILKGFGNGDGTLTLKGEIFSSKEHLFGLFHWDGSFRTGKFVYRGNIECTNTSNMIEVQSGNTLPMSLDFEGNFKLTDAGASNGGFLQLPASASGDIKFRLSGTFESNSAAPYVVWLRCPVKVNLEALCCIFPNDGSLFKVEDNQTLLSSDFDLTTNNVEVDSDTDYAIFDRITVTTGSYEAKALGTLRCESTTIIPAYASLVYLPDITVPSGANFANTDLTATGDRVHTFDGNNFILLQTTGTQTYGTAQFRITSNDIRLTNPLVVDNTEDLLLTRDSTGRVQSREVSSITNSPTVQYLHCTLQQLTSTVSGASSVSIGGVNVPFDMDGWFVREVTYSVFKIGSGGDVFSVRLRVSTGGNGTSGAIIGGTDATFDSSASVWRKTVVPSRGTPVNWGDVFWADVYNITNSSYAGLRMTVILGDTP